MRARPSYPISELPRRRRRLSSVALASITCGLFALAAVALWIGIQ